MNKLLSRTLMLGALVGCMATAAWAGNVEVDPELFCPANMEEGFAAVNTKAENYYLTGIKQKNVYEEWNDEYESSEKLGVDADGNIVWSSGESNYDSFTQKLTYENGYLSKVVTKETVKETGAVRTTTETYTYDDQGRVLTHRDYIDWEGQCDDRAAKFAYGDHTVEITETYYDEVIASYTYDLDDQGRVVTLTEKSKNNTTDQMDVTCIHYYTYDDQGNLVLDTVNDDNELIAAYEYENGLCVKETDGYGGVRTYTYDENGNAIKSVYTEEDGTATVEYTYALIPDGATPSEFSDVQDTGAFYYDAVVWANELGITNGSGNGKFAPKSKCTRAQLVTFLWRAAGSPEPNTTDNPFTDVTKDDYFYKAVLWAVENKVTTGTSATTFAPYRPCDRAQIVTLIYRAAGEPEVGTTDNPFADVPADAYYVKAVLWAVENGITNGKSADSFVPNATCTRGEGVTFLYRGIGLY